MTGRLQRFPFPRWIWHLFGIVALMWAPLLNGQPFFFPDTTAYVRAADLAVQNQYPNPRPLEREAIRQLLQDAFDGRRPR